MAQSLDDGFETRKSQLEAAIAALQRELKEPIDVHTFIPENGSQVSGFPKHCSLWSTNEFMPLVATPQLATGTALVVIVT